MTREEINSATPEWLSEETAKVMGWKDYFISISGQFRVLKDNAPFYDVWNPAKNLNDAYQLEEKVKEMGLIEKYTDNLLGIIDNFENNYVIYDSALESNPWEADCHRIIFNMVNATPEQRTKAFLLAIMEVKEPPKSDWEELADICSESARKAGLTQERSRELLQEAREILKPGN